MEAQVTVEKSEKVNSFSDKKRDKYEEAELYTFDDNTWQNKDKTDEERAELIFRGKLLNARMQMPLDLKIIYAKNRIRKVIEEHGADACVVGFSGGKDSTVVSHLVLSMGYKIDHYYINTRLEYPECVEYVKAWTEKHGVKLLVTYPDQMPVDVWKKWGYPMFTKEAAECLERLRLGQKVAKKKLDRVRKYLKYKDVFISARCCDILKKQPARRFFKKSGKKVAILGVTADESQIRRVNWVRKGCIYETKGQVIANPIIFFTEEDIYAYAKKFNIKLAGIYEKGIRRNGCFICGFGCHLRNENTFQVLKRVYPHLHDGVMEKWGFKEICKQCDVKWE
jgi:3'-phosphoadenosine 5'-phosphosulfate sulfotransferase (PAPS reductase)/FAD synthetase